MNLWRTARTANRFRAKIPARGDMRRAGNEVLFFFEDEAWQERGSTFGVFATRDDAMQIIELLGPPDPAEIKRELGLEEGQS